MKNNKLLIKKVTACILLAFTLTSCKKDYFDINTNPNDPADVPVQYLLPSAEAAVTQVAGGTFNIYGGIWGQYWTQNPSASQYRILDQYNITADEFDRPWTSMYADALQDLKVIESKATADGQQNYVAISKILQAYGYQILTDNFGDVPFSEALQPDEILSPKFDPQEQVYNGIIQMTKDGLAQINDTILTGNPAEDDLLLHGDMFMWRKFGNTLLLRMYMRLSEVRPDLAQSGIAELQASGAEFLAEGETVQLNYGTEGGNTNPLYATALTLNYGQNIVASATSIDTLLGLNDPRIDAFYTPASNDQQVGIAQGSFNTVVPGSPISSPAPMTGANDQADPSAPVVLISSYESLFLQAEAAARGWLGGDAQALYEAGITESFVHLGLSDSAAMDYVAQTTVAYPSGGSLQDQIEVIVTQKWISMNGTQGNEAWNEWRRTGYPDFLVISAANLNGGQFPQRMLYPSIEQTRNANFPGQKPLTEKVWWDVN